MHLRKSHHCALPLFSALLGCALNCLTICEAEPKSAEKTYLKNVQHGELQFTSIGAMNFGPSGLLLVAEPKGASIVAIETGDTGPVEKLQHRVDDVTGLVAARLGAPVTGIRIVDLAVNPVSGRIYLSVVRLADNRPVIITINASGEVADLPLDKVAHVRVSLPAAENAKIGNITDVAFAGDRVLAAGQSSEEFSSKIFSLPLPLTHGQAGAVYSAETFHVAHNKWETKAPIQSFVPYEEDGKHYVVGAFACTPVAKFPIDSLQSGANVKGTSVVELGSGNRPLDMFTYDKGGKHWLVTHTQRFHTPLFGPSKYWGARIDMSYLAEADPAKINEKAVRRDVKTKEGPAGIEIVDSLFGAVHVDKLNNEQAVVLREDGEKLALELAQLP